jgi:acetyl esterase/lipase
VRRSVAGLLTAAVITAAASVLLAPPALAGAPVGSADVVGASPPPLGPGKTTVTYCAGGGVAQTLDVYEPDPLPSAPVPVVVYVHGGGWVQGDSALTSGSLVAQVAQAVDARGWVFVSIDYRLAPRFRWPAQIDDASCAVRFLRAARAALHINPAAIGVMGDSAGGQIVSLLGLTGGNAVHAVVDLYGPADLTTTDWAHAPLIQVYAPQAFGTVLGPGTPSTPSTEALVAASPVTYVRPHAPPFLIIQGDDDTVVPPDQSVELAGRLQAAGDSATLVMVSHAQHGLLPVPGGPVTPSVPQLAGQVTAFLVRHLQPSPSVPRSGHRRSL